MKKTSKARKNMLEPRLRLVSFGVLGLALAYIFGLRALDTGGYWYYAVCFICAWFGFKYVFNALKYKS